MQLITHEVRQSFQIVNLVLTSSSTWEYKIEASFAFDTKINYP
jgi:hypothetical protein